MGVPIYVYMSVPSVMLNIDNLSELYKNFFYSRVAIILNNLKLNKIYSDVVSIKYIITNVTQHNNFLSNLGTALNRDIPQKIKYIIRQNISNDNTSIMSEIYYDVAKNSGCFFNILFLDFKEILKLIPSKIDFQLYDEKSIILSNWSMYLTYFYIDNAEECIGNLSNANVCGVDLIESSPYPYYYSNWWWTDSNYIKTLPYSSNKCTPYITNGLNGGFYVSLWTSINWLNIDQTTSQNYFGYYKNKDSNINYVSIKNGYVYPVNLSCFKPIIPDENKPNPAQLSKHIFSLGTYKNSEEIPTKKYVKPEITPCEYRDRLLRWNRPKPKTQVTTPPVPIFQLGNPGYGNLISPFAKIRGNI